MKTRESFEEVYPALWEIRYRAKNVIPAKAVEECPEGKDLRPPRTEESALVSQLISKSRAIQMEKSKLPCANL